MLRYLAYVSERDDDDAPNNRHRICGAPVGLATSDWPRWHGRPMQHAFTVDLAPLELAAARAAGARALVVFVDSYYELDLDSSDGITLVWLTQAQIDAHGETPPPADFVPELRPNREQLGEGGGYETGDVTFSLEPAEDDEDASFGVSFVGGQPVWSDAGEPATRPQGAFVLQFMAHDFPISRSNACLFVFEQGAYLQAEYPDDDQRPLPWATALARSRELVVLDTPPAPDALQKWGGLARGIGSYAWPHGLSHILTWVPEPEANGSQAVAYALFGRLSNTSDWDEELRFYQVQEISASDLEGWDPEDVELPHGVELLDERAIELRELPKGTSWRDLQALSFLGPRPAWRAPDLRSARVAGEGPVVQLTDAVLPVSPGRGTLHLLTEGYPIWHPAPGAPQAKTVRYKPDGTLYAGETTAAIVVGWRLEFREFSVLPERVEALERTLLGALATREIRLRLYVPSDTNTDRSSEVQGGFVLGRAVAMVAADDYDPERVDPQAIATALAGLPALDDSFWREALAFADMEPPSDPSAYLLSWGPLCYAGVYAGVAATRGGTPVYKFIANQNMEQEWSTSGIDGVRIESVEFSSIDELALTEAQLELAAKHDKPVFWLICRYD